MQQFHIYMEVNIFYESCREIVEIVLKKKTKIATIT